MAKMFRSSEHFTETLRKSHEFVSTLRVAFLAFQLGRVLLKNRWKLKAILRVSRTIMYFLQTLKYVLSFEMHINGQNFIFRVKIHKE